MNIYEPVAQDLTLQYASASDAISVLVQSAMQTREMGARAFTRYHKHQAADQRYGQANGNPFAAAWRGSVLYSAFKMPDGRWFLENRDYQPVGRPYYSHPGPIRSGKTIDIYAAEYPHNHVTLHTPFADELLCDGEVHMFSDGSAPWLDAKTQRVYRDRLYAVLWHFNETHLNHLATLRLEVSRDVYNRYPYPGDEYLPPESRAFKRVGDGLEWLFNEARKHGWKDPREQA